MWCTKRRIEPYVVPVRPNLVSDIELSQSEFIESSPVNEFMFQEVEVDGKKTTRLTSDIYMLFNQQRLDRMSRESLVDYFNKLSVSDNQMSSLRSKLGDEQLILFVKSRFIQSRSELMAWSQYLMSSQDELVAAAAAEQQPAEPPAADDSAEP